MSANDRAKREEKELEERRTHPDYMRGVPPAPPEVVANHHEHTSVREAGHLPEEEPVAPRGARDDIAF